MRTDEVTNILFIPHKYLPRMDPEAVELRHLRSFVAVAEELHFGRAARRLRVAQPALSVTIRQLEHRVGAPLFLRSSRHVELTPAGLLLLERARRLLAEVSKAIGATQRAGQGELLTLRVGFTDSAALSVLPTALSRFRRSHPGVHLDLLEGNSSSQLEALESDMTDVAVVAGPVSLPTLHVETVTRDRFVVALPRAHPLARNATVSLSGLNEVELIQGPSHVAPEYQNVIARMFARAGVTPRIVHRATEYQATLSLVAAGLGASVVPAFVQNLQRSGVVFRPVRGAGARAEVVVARRRGAASTAAELFVGLLKLA
jgi:DNA-binding transcriptional LysR family regulator